MATNGFLDTRTRTMSASKSRQVSSVGRDGSCGAVPLGIVDERVSIGDHIAYFWKTAEEFERCCDFLMMGFRSHDHCVILGNHAMNRRVCDVLAQHGINVPDLRRQNQLRVLQPATTTDATVKKLAFAFREAVDRGASLIRLLVNHRWEDPCWPHDEGLLMFETKVAAAARPFPSVTAWIYDEQTPFGSMVLHGALKTHSMMAARNLLRMNPTVDELRKRLVRRLQELRNQDTMPTYQPSRRKSRGTSR